MKEKSILHGILLFFLREKNSILKENTGIDMFNDEDYKDICSWSEDKVFNFLFHLKDVKSTSDIALCPWCLLYHTISNNTCIGCGYGARHKSCIIPLAKSSTTVLNPGSTYEQIICKLTYNGCKSISKDDEIQNLVELTIEMFDKIILNTDRSYEEIIKTMSRLITFVDEIPMRRDDLVV